MTGTAERTRKPAPYSSEQAVHLYHDGTEHFLQIEEDIAHVYLEAPPEMEEGQVMSFRHGDAQFDDLTREEDGRWKATIPLQKHQNTQYRFKVQVSGRTYWLSQAGVSPGPTPFMQDFKISRFTPPQWVHDRVFYQIFPDRFKNGDPSINLKSGEYKYEDRAVVSRKWYMDPNTSMGANEYFGGDLEGIRISMDYFHDLGVNALYLNPIFQSPSVHAYDTQDYFRIDEHFGTNEGFAKLVEELHQNDIRILLDGVFNHTGSWHKWMNRERIYSEPGAFQGGPTREYYTYLSDEPEAYMAWFGFPTLPKLNYANKDVMEQMITGKNSVVRHWLKAPYNIDGWRLDAAPVIGKHGTDEGNHEVIQAIWKSAREENPEAYIIGEHFGDALAWLQGGEEDGAMNYYGFTIPTWAFLGGEDESGKLVYMDAAEYARNVMHYLSFIPFQNQLALFNSLCSHDTKRFSSICQDLEHRKLGATMLFAHIGVPCIYYGDEIGLEGEGDPLSRRTMPWDWKELWETGLYDHYKQLARIRKQEKALQKGSYAILDAEGDALVIQRRHGNEFVRVVLTRGAPFTHTLDGRWTNLLDGSEVQGEVHLHGTGALILKKQ
ncbi:maltodextrin glucosidase [Deinococcus cellulosilyticus]|uniref:Maltodextrin glucosidase n=1 Tax=Deinococcus cellulosilyticus (strain DSM 18568 / NBRC 106333 / KACC 11606 / 5516J-15) TaxID=1223518 RepID=A0A511MZX7_DEIC1|nr:maltodextrin glucosidase [Deinococcus cellulosilyticus]GEM46109.1 maltodextrin glucosidase [Deinococcus cellulosilyticus NBRC 106333 = KACC 11606]